MISNAPKPQRAELDNGLRVVCVPQPTLHSAAISLHVRVGSRFESRERNGCSHFLEHMLFRGTPSFASAHEQALALERLGGTLYAATHTDFGLLSLSVPPENVEPAFAAFAEIVSSPRFTEIELERAIIREEILETLDDDGHQIDPDNLSRALIFGDHSLGFPITGTVHNLRSLGVDALRAHHALHYTGTNCVLCFAGAIDAAQCEKLARQLLAGLPAGALIKGQPAPRSQTQARFNYVENQMSQTDLRLAFRAPGEHDPQEPAAEALLRVLDDGMSTRLYARVCDARGLCYNVSADYETFEDDGVLDLAAVVQHARAPTVVRELCEIVSELASEGPTEEEMDKMRLRFGWETRCILDDADSLAEFHGLSALAGIADSLEARHQEILAVSSEQVRAVARSVFQPGNLSCVAVGLLESAHRKEIERILRGFPSQS